MLNKPTQSYKKLVEWLKHVKLIVNFLEIRYNK